MATLTEIHRQSQLALRAKVLRDLVTLWPAMDWSQVDRTFPLWYSAVSALITSSRSTSAGLSAAYLQAFRLAQGVPGKAPLVLAPSMPPAVQMESSLRYTSARSIIAATVRGVAREQAMANAFVASSGTVSRLVLDAGRDTLRDSLAADPKAAGWRRVTSGSSCKFCQMLAGRGAVYRAETARFRSHDHCGCIPEPVYRTTRPVLADTPAQLAA